MDRKADIAEDDVDDAEEEAGELVDEEEREEARPLSGEAHACRFGRRRISLLALLKGLALSLTPR